MRIVYVGGERDGVISRLPKKGLSSQKVNSTHFDLRSNGMVERITYSNISANQSSKY